MEAEGQTIGEKRIDRINLLLLSSLISVDTSWTGIDGRLREASRSMRAERLESRATELGLVAGLGDAGKGHHCWLDRGWTFDGR